MCGLSFHLATVYRSIALGRSANAFLKASPFDVGYKGPYVAQWLASCAGGDSEEAAAVGRLGSRSRQGEGPFFSSFESALLPVSSTCAQRAVRCCAR